MLLYFNFLFWMYLPSTCVCFIDKHISPWYFNISCLSELFISLSDLPSPKGVLIIHSPLYFKGKPPYHCVWLSAAKHVNVHQGERVYPEERAVYLRPYFCLVEPLLWEVKGHGNDEAELCWAVCNPSDQTRQHRHTNSRLMIVMSTDAITICSISQRSNALLLLSGMFILNSNTAEVKKSKVWIIKYIMYYLQCQILKERKEMFMLIYPEMFLWSPCLQRDELLCVWLTVESLLWLF